MKNNLKELPFAPGKFFVVENYWETAGVLNSLKAGVAPESVRRPLAHTKVIDANNAHMTFTSQPKQIDKQETEDKPYPVTASSSVK